MPLIQVTMIEGRTAEQKRALLTALTQAVHETIGAPLDSIRAWVTDVPGEQFMSAGTLASERQAAAAAPAPSDDRGPGQPASAKQSILPPGGPDRSL